MTETGLLIAQAAFIVLLYGFIWLVVRSSGKQVGISAPQPVSTSGHEPIAPITDLDAQPLDAEPDLDVELFEISDAPVAGAATPMIDMAPATPEPDLAMAAASAAALHDDATPEGPAKAAPDDADDGPDTDQSGAFDLSSDLQPRLVVERSAVLAPGETFALEGGMTIGRSPSSGVLVDDEFVSHMHARVMRRGEFYFISDLGSTNGTVVNGRPVTEDRQLRVRDEIQVGETVLRYEE